MNMKIILSSLLTFLIFITVNAQNIVLDLYPEGEIPNYQQTDEKEERDTTDIVKIGKVQKPDISVFLPSEKNATGEAVIICPGGGYWILAYDWEGTDIAKYWNSKGIAAIVLKYRLPTSKSQVDPHKSPLLDAQRAMRLTRYHAEEWHINPKKIGIMGFSAGGHLASTLSTHFDNGNKASDDPVEQVSCRPDFSILVYPVISFTAHYMHSGSQRALIGEDAPQQIKRFYSNELQITENTPPAILIHSIDDNAVSYQNSVTYFENLQKNNIESELHIYPYGGHGYSLAIGQGHLSTWPDRCYDWVKYITTK